MAATVEFKFPKWQRAPFSVVRASTTVQTAAIEFTSEKWNMAKRNALADYLGNANDAQEKCLARGRFEAAAIETCLIAFCAAPKASARKERSKEQAEKRRLIEKVSQLPD